ncbi:hypothetical protein HDR60_04865 [bacterium]|nr:hypothetical protein [bacterium]
MSNNKNLIPINKRTTEEQREIAQKGGIASGKARREKRKFKKILNDLLENKSPDGISFKEKLCISLIQKGLNGDVRAICLILQFIDEEEKTNDIENFKEIQKLLEMEQEKDN